MIGEVPVGRIFNIQRFSIHDGPVIFLICTVTVAISPIDSISQISLNSSSFV